MNYWRYIRYFLAICFLFATLHILPLAGLTLAVPVGRIKDVVVWSVIFISSNCLMVVMVVVLTMFWNIGGRK